MVAEEKKDSSTNNTQKQGAPNKMPAKHQYRFIPSNPAVAMSCNFPMVAAS